MVKWNDVLVTERIDKFATAISTRQAELDKKQTTLKSSILKEWTSLRQL